MAEKMTPQGLIIGLIEDEPIKHEPENEEVEEPVQVAEGKPQRGRPGRKPKN